MATPEQDFLAEATARDAATEEAEWQALLASGQPQAAAPPGEDDPGVVRGFLEGLTRGMRETPNVFRPMAEGEDIIARAGEVPALPFTMAFNAVTEGLVGAGVISKRTQEQLGHTMMGAIPAIMSPVRPVKGKAAKGAKAAPEPVATAAPDALPGVAGESRVNVARIDTTAEVKSVITEINARNAERLAEHRKTQSHEKTIEGAKAITVEEALRLPETTATLPETITRLRDVHVATAETLTDVAKATVKGDKAAAAKLVDTITVAAEVDARLDTGKRNVARGLEAMKIQAEGARAPLTAEQMAQLAEQTRGVAADPAVLAQNILNLKDTASRMAYARQWGTLARSGMNAAHELYINLLLTPMSHAANFIGNATIATNAIWERFLAASMPIKGREITFAEPYAMMTALPRGLVNGIKGFVRYGMDDASMSKMDFADPKIAAAKFGLEGTPLGAGIDLAGKVVRVNTNLLGRGDALFKGVAFHAEMETLAVRDAMLRGLKGKEAARHIEYIRAHPEEFPSLVESANKFKLIQTLQDPMGPFGEAVSKLRESVPVVGFTVLPFLKTLNRIGVYAAHRTFPMNVPSILWGEIGADLAAGGAQRQLALAKIANSAIITSAAAYYASEGLITGAGPRDPDMKRAKQQEGWQEYAVKVGDKYYSISRLDPFSLTLGTIANFVEIAAEVPEMQADEFAMAITLAMAKGMVNKTYMENVANVFAAIDDPSAKAPQLLKSVATGLVPGAVRQVERIMDPALREAQTLLEAMQAGVPGYSKYLPPRRYLNGMVRETLPALGPDFLSPISVSSVTTDPVAKEIVRLKVSLSMPSRVIYGTRPPRTRMEPQTAREGVELTPKEYDRLVVLAGNELKVDGKGMWDRLGELIRSGEYQRQSDGPDGGKATMIRAVVLAYREAAVAQLIEETPELRRAVEGRIRDRVRRLTPTDTTDLLSTLGR